LILFVTDLVDFSGLVSTLGDRVAQDLMHIHNEVLRSRLRAHGGREVTHTGDGIIAAFSAASAAVECAVEVQTRLAEIRETTPRFLLRARIGLHAGRPLPEEGRLFGTSVNFAVRVCSVAQPNEVLISECVHALLPAGCRCAARTPVPLKGFDGTYRLYSLHTPFSVAPVRHERQRKAERRGAAMGAALNGQGPGLDQVGELLAARRRS
jgi:class 3 adenylate cyclase